MKVIILAAGRGSRLNKYTENLPKGMLNVLGKSIIERQIEVYKSCGISDISIVRGYCGEKINYSEINYYENKLFAETNMVESLFCAIDKLEGDVIISYADILFEKQVVEAVVKDSSDIGVLVDRTWKEYWQFRYGKIDFDTESLKIGDNNKIISLGVSDPLLEEIDGRYVGMIRLNNRGCTHFKEMYREAKLLFWDKPWINGRTFQTIFMTDFLQEMINRKHEVKAILIEKGWLEFDTNEDYEKVLMGIETGEIESVFHF